MEKCLDEGLEPTYYLSIFRESQEGLNNVSHVNEKFDILYLLVIQDHLRQTLSKFVSQEGVNDVSHVNKEFDFMYSLVILIYLHQSLHQCESQEGVNNVSHVN